MKRGDKFGLVQVLENIKKGFNPTDISKKYGIPKQTLSYYVDKLKKLGCIEKVGYGTWRYIRDLNKSQFDLKDTFKVNSDFSKIRGHAFIWTISFPGHKYNWKQIATNYKKRYKKPKLTFNLICHGKVLRTIFKNRKIWLTRNGLTIYEPLDFMGKSSFSVKGMAVFEMDRLIKDLIKELKQPFHSYFFNCSREHFAHVHSQIAKQFNDKKEKIKVEWNGKHFWIDHSDHIHEEETDDALVSTKAQKFYEDQLKTDFAVTPTMILQGFDKTLELGRKNEEKLDYYAENQVTHVKLMQSIDENLRKQTEFFNRIEQFLTKSPGDNN